MSSRGAVALLAFAGAVACGELAARLVDGGSAPATSLLGAGLAVHVGIGLLAVAGVTFVPGGDPVDRLGLRPGRLGAAGTAWAVVGTVALSHALHRVLALLALRERGALGRVDEAVASASQVPAGLAVALVGIAVAAPVVEEVLFRGLLLRGLLQRLGPAAAVGLSAAAFGLFHMDAIQGSAALVLGLYLGVVAWRAGSARPAIVCHLTNNVVGVASVVLGLGAAAPGGAWTVLPLLALAALGLRGVWRGAAPPTPPTEPGTAPAAEPAPPEG